jgi:hypothetical protein
MSTGMFSVFQTQFQDQILLGLYRTSVYDLSLILLLICRPG